MNMIQQGFEDNCSSNSLISLTTKICCHLFITSKTDISKYPIKSKNIVWTHLLFYFHFSCYYLKLLTSQSKFSGTRKFALRYQQFGMNFDFDI